MFVRRFERDGAPESCADATCGPFRLRAVNLGSWKLHKEECTSISAPPEAHFPRKPMSAIKIETTIDEATARAIPGLRPLLGKRVELIARRTDQPDVPTPKHTLDELLGARLTPASGVGPISLADMERAIEKGAVGAGD